MCTCVATSALWATLKPCFGWTALSPSAPSAVAAAVMPLPATAQVRGAVRTYIQDREKSPLDLICPAMYASPGGPPHSTCVAPLIVPCVVVGLWRGHRSCRLL